MRVLRGLWEIACWVGSLYLLLTFPMAVTVTALILLASLPLKRFFMDDNDIKDMYGADAATSVTKVGALTMLTQMTTVKSLIYANRKRRIQPNPDIKMLDVTTKKGE